MSAAKGQPLPAEVRARFLDQLYARLFQDPDKAQEPGKPAEGKKAA